MVEEITGGIRSGGAITMPVRKFQARIPVHPKEATYHREAIHRRKRRNFRTGNARETASCLIITRIAKTGETLPERSRRLSLSRKGPNGCLQN
jgi:hypothetical protein